jgi:flavin reductase (DIM6/NTAB) family NADH-FMN oxidoreductase RutF
MYREISVQDIKINPFTSIGEDWMLISAGNKNNFNTMTASWGGLGVLWNKNVAFAFVRPSRYTYEFTQKEEMFTLCFLDKQYKDALAICGKISGRNENKVQKANLTPYFTDNTVSFEEAKLIIVCKKLYIDDIKKENMLDNSIMKNYLSGDFHRMYVAEVVKIYERNDI